MEISVLEEKEVGNDCEGEAEMTLEYYIWEKTKI